jgi:ribosomal-protein-alanine N-acetyltransferase
MAMNTILQTARLLLRPLEGSDLEALHSITSGPTVMQFVGDLKPFTLEKTERMIRDAVDHYRTRGFGEYAVMDKESGSLAGYGGFAVLPERTCVEIDYILRPEFWGRGLATELAAALVDHGFQRLRLDTIGASFDPQNHASMRVAAKVGLRYERTGVDEHGLPTVYYVMRRPA